jgi:hypothetical protein
MSETILAIDLGKFNSVLCWYDPAGRTAEYRTAKSTPADPVEPTAALPGVLRESHGNPAETAVFLHLGRASWRMLTP